MFIVKNTTKKAFISAILLVLISQTHTLFAAAMPDYYEEPGINPFRDYQLGEMQEHIDPFGGGLILQINDIVVPQNGGLDVVVKRIYRSLHGQPSQLRRYLPGRTPMGVGWDLHFGRLWYSTTLTNNSPAGCKIGNANDPSTPLPVLELQDGTRQVLYNSDSNDYAFITKSRWIGKCRSSTAGGGLEVISPDGIKYVFDREGKVAGTTAWSVTRIEDPNGNYIAFEYASASTTQHDILKNIYTSESPSTPVVTFGYEQETAWEARLKTVTANGKTWTYNYQPVYEGTNTWNSEYHLDSVQPPEGDIWDYDYYTDGSKPGLFSLKSITTPGGAKTEYAYDYKQFGGQNDPLTTVVSKKKLYIGSVKKGEWTYTFDPSNGSSSDYDLTTITGPEGRIEYKHFGSRQATSDGTVWQVGSLKEKRYFNIDNAQVQLECYTWEAEKISSQWEFHRSLGYLRKDIPTNTPRLKERKIFRDRTGTVNCNSTADDSTYSNTYTYYEDGYGNPHIVTEQNGSNIKSTTYTYDAKPAYWLIHLVNTIDISGINGAVDIDLDYDTKGNLTKENRHGVVTDYYYLSSGNIDYIKYPEIQTLSGLKRSITDFNNYKRGTPKTEILASNNAADQTAITREVNDDGTIKSETIDGKTTAFKYDGLLRIEGTDAITTPQPNDSNIDINWNNTNTKCTLTRGDFVEETTYDGLGRRIEVTAGGIVKKFEYDALGRLIFESYPQYTSSGYSRKGKTFEYDILNRITKQSYTGFSGATNIFVEFDYSPGNQIIITNERKFSTTYTYKSFGDPDTKWLTKIEAPEDVTTDIERDNLGNIDYVTQGGIKREYTYNNRFQLIAIDHPELGPSATDKGIHFGRDEAGNMTSRWVGDSGPMTNFYYDYQGRVDQIIYPNPSTTPNVNYDYYPTGKLEKVTKGITSWNYTYNDNDILESETLTLGTPINKSFTIGYFPNDKDAIQAINYPNDFMIYLSPDVLGRPKNIISPSHLTQENPTVLVGNIDYHPNGAIYTMQLGNGLTTTMTQDNRLRTKKITTYNSLVDLTYGYDDNGNVISIADGINSLFGFPTVGTTPGLGYDGLDRLTHIQGTQVIWYKESNNPDRNNIERTNIGGVSLNHQYDSTRNRLTSIAGSFHTFQYDNNGNVTSNGKDTFVYDEASHLVQIPTQGVANHYDGHGRLTWQVKNGKNIITVYNHAGQLIYEEDSARLRDYVRLGSTLVATHDECNPETGDSDSDGIPDCTEIQHGLNPNDASDASLDKDGDGLTNLQEVQLGTNISLSDTDGDGMDDGYEYSVGLDPTVDDASIDSDADGLLNIEEMQYGTDPFNPDTDNDGITDGVEVANGTSPTFNPAVLVPIINLLLN